MEKPYQTTSDTSVIERFASPVVARRLAGLARVPPGDRAQPVKRRLTMDEELNETISRRTSRTKHEEQQSEPLSSSRFETSLSHLTLRFIETMRSCKGIVDLNIVAKDLDVPKRRLYDITNVLEGVDLVQKTSKNHIRWKQSENNSPETAMTLKSLKERTEKLLAQEKELDLQEEILQNSLEQLVASSSSSSLATTATSTSTSTSTSKLSYVSYQDIKAIPEFQGCMVIGVKAPAGTRLEVPDSGDDNEEFGTANKRYHMYLHSDNGPIIVTMVQDSTFSKLKSQTHPFLQDDDMTGSCIDLNLGIIDKNNDDIFDPSSALSLHDDILSHHNNNNNDSQAIQSKSDFVQDDLDSFMHTYCYSLNDSEGLADLYDIDFDGHISSS